MTIEQVIAITQALGLVDLGEARVYLDEEGQIEAILVMRGDVQESNVATSPEFPNTACLPQPVWREESSHLKRARDLKTLFKRTEHFW